MTHALVTSQDELSEIERSEPDTAGRWIWMQRWRMRPARSVQLVGLVGGANDGYVPTPYERAMPAVRLKNWSKAIDLVRPLRARDGSDVPDVSVLEATCHFARGELDLAEARLREAIRRRPFESVLHHELGMVALQRGDASAARAHWVRGLRIDPADPVLRDAVRRWNP